MKINLTVQENLLCGAFELHYTNLNVGNVMWSILMLPLLIMAKKKKIHQKK